MRLKSIFLINMAREKQTFRIGPMLLVFVAVLAGLGILILTNLDKKWADPTTWSVESRVVLPKETSVLKVKNELGEIQANGEQAFSFETEYCYLYEIEATKDTAKLRCSLLPMYYAERGKEVPKDWKEKSDIFLSVKSSDAEPSDFLGRIDKSFSSVASLGSFTYPVSVTIEGVNKYPSASFTNKVRHSFYVLLKEKQPLEVQITAYSVSRLDLATPAQKHAYAVAKVPEIWREIERQVDVNYKTFSDYQKLLNTYRNVFKNYRKICSNLTTCAVSYQANPADQFIYYWYLLKNRDEPKYTALLSTMKHNYPFVPRNAVNKELACPTCEPDWREMSPGMFPICPINDIIARKATSDSELLLAYTETLREYTPSSDSAATKSLDQFSTTSFIDAGMWDLEQIQALDGVCSYLLKEGFQGRELLASKLVNNYYEMISTTLGLPLSNESASFEDIIYRSIAFTPYNSNLILDYAVMRRRETSTMDTAVKATQKYTDIRSLWSSLILLYLYEN